MVTSVVVVDDHPLIRRGLASLLDAEPDLSVSGTAASIKESIDLLKGGPDVVVVDLVLPDGSGLDLIRKIRRLAPKTKVLVSSMRDEKVFAWRCLKAGASGYVHKQEPLEALMSAIRRVLKGEITVSERMTTRLLGGISSSQESVHDGIERLSDRELEVLEMIGAGMGTQQIAKLLHLSAKTIDSFRERIKNKLDIGSVTELVHFATSWAMH